jgi:hypothetical protein
MAHPSHHPSAVHNLALAVFAGGVALHYGWALAPAEHQAQVWNAAGAIARLAMLLALVWPITDKWVAAVVLWYAGEETQIAACSAAYIVRPWEILPGQAQCSALLQTDLGAYGIAVVAMIVLTQPANLYSTVRG